MRLFTRSITRLGIAIFLTGITTSFTLYSQKNPAVITPELMLGKIVSNYKKFPGAQTRKTLVVNIGSYLNNPKVHSHQYYNFPQVGVSLGFSDLGNKENLGEEISVVPYFLINASNKLKHSWRFKLGLGASYFTKYYNEETNRVNQAIGSHLNWTFQLFLYYTLHAGERVNILAGGGYWHSSNSHTQLPNYGLNSGMLSLSFQYYLQKIDLDLRKDHDAEKVPLQRFIQVRSGLGVHELGSTIGPAIGPKRPVYTMDLGYGFLFNQQLKVYGGVFFRFYSSFYHYLKDNHTDGAKNYAWQASNINFHLGVEYLVGHVGMNCEGGLNLYKPFYNDFYALFENGNKFNEFRMSMFNTRMGLNFYLKNTNKNPASNLAIGAHINANFGKADFGEVSLTYMRFVSGGK